jgi:phosphoribosylaminoimidazole-succinocarboxamide synthase
MESIVYETNIPGLPLIKRGKVRDIYDAGDALLIVATDRLSAFDVVLPDPIPDKGKVLTGISLFWFGKMTDIVANHLISSEIADFPDPCRDVSDQLEGRSMLVRKAEPLPVECIVRGYLSGSGWKDYQRTGTVCGIPLPADLQESDLLPEPLFTPSTKAEAGEHDVNIDFAQVCRLIGKETAEAIRRLSLSIYQRGAQLAEEKGILIADTKFEFGKVGDEILLIDEVLTPDSSRFWPQDTYRPGGSQQSFDKQYVRDYLIGLDWDQKPPAPALPKEVIESTRSKYREALSRLAGTGP